MVRGPTLVQTVVVALGGNAILKQNEKGTAVEQLKNVRKTSRFLVELMREGYRLVITHGNGPQIGGILLKNEHSEDILPSMPLDICGAQSQGMIGYMLQQSIGNEIAKADLDFPVVSLVTQTIVDSNDKAFMDPSKPIGLFYSSTKAKELRKKGWVMIEDSGRGYRRVVPSPEPKKIVELDTIRTLVEKGTVVIAAGGGGIPVTPEEDGQLHGVVAVVDKDLTAQTIACEIRAQILLMLTDVENVSLNFGKADQIDLDHLNTEDARFHLQKGEFGIGSMAPKVEAAINFVRSGGEKAIITSLELCKQAIEGKAGTTISELS
ncbi:MAG: carbamate kinase [Candidatus Bathyarchaeota archaeon]|nr:MAG: carbamate kinase [Candidatus Bathyarchaeota archaeon]